MNCSEKEVLQYVAEEDVKFVRLAFCDVFGRQKNTSIPAEELYRAFAHGVAFDASAISCFNRARKIALSRVSGMKANPT